MALVRPGIINLDFKDVSQMAKDIDANNPLKNLIAVGGKVLSERERDILYRRALAQSQGLEAPNEKTAIEFIKENGGNALENIKNFSLNSYDKVKNLIAPEMIEYSKEVGEKKVTPVKVYGDGNAKPIPDPNGNAELVEFPTTEINNSKNLRAPETKIIGDKVDWESPRNGYKTEFPTTIVGTKLVSPENLNKSNKNLKSNENNISKDNKSNNSMASWSEMYRLSPDRATFDYTRVKNDADKLKEQKAKTQGLFKEVAADFANLDPNDQAKWTSTRDNWLSIDPNLASFLPASASQDAWDRIQSQGGFGKNVSPKGEFATRKYLEDQVKQSTFLSQTARTAGKAAEADFYAAKALELQKKLDGGPTDSKTPEEWINDYSAEINDLKKKTTKDKKADTKELFAKLATKIGSGATLDKVKEEINSQLDDEMSGNKSVVEYSDSQQAALGEQYSTQASDLVKVKSKINALKTTINKIPAGAARIAAKELQGDVLAESEFSSYKNDSPIVQAFANLANKLGVTYITPADAKVLVNALIKKYNAEASDYINATKGIKNTYKNTQVNLVDEITDKPSSKEEAKSGRFSKFGKTK